MAQSASRLRALLGPEEEPRPANRLRAMLEGVWESDPADPRRERRALPGGGYEYRAKGGTAPEPPQNRPESAPVSPPPVDHRAALIAAKRAEVERIRAGGDINRGPVAEPSTLDRIKRSAQLVRGGMTEGADFLANLPETAARALVSPLKAVDDYQKEQARERSLQSQIDLDQKLGRQQTPERLAQIAKALPPGPKPMPEPEGLSFYGLPEIVDETLQDAREERERLTEEMLDDLAVNSSPLDAALMATYGPRFAGNLADPTMLYAPLKGAAVARQGAGKVAEELAAPAARLRALVGEVEAPAAQAVRPREIPPDIAELAAKSLEIGPAPERAPRGRVPVAEILDLDPPEAPIRTLTAVSPTGDEVGHLRYQKALPRGPYRGSSLARTPEGEALVSRLRETDPDIFPPAGHPAAPEGVPSAPGLRAGEAGGALAPDTLTVPRPQPRGTAVTERGQRIDFDYEIRDASDLITSHDDTLRPNPAFPAEVQPRDRSRVASAAQVSRIEQRLDPELLGVSPKVSDGAPFIGPDGVVESGNARSIALRRAYLSASPQGESYRTWLRETASRLGLDPAAVEAVPSPVLVRVRRTPVDRAAFAIEANETGLAAMSAAERAGADAQLITPDMLASLRIPEGGGGVNFSANRDFVRFFASRVNPAEQGAMFDARGALSVEGERRLQNAVLARAFGDPLAVAKLTEHADLNVRAIGSALVKEAPRFARMRDGIAAGRLYPLDISDDVTAALRKLSALREEGMQVSDYLAQGALFGSDLTPEARGLLALFDANARSGSRVGEILSRYAGAVEALGDPGQVRLFGQQPIPSKLDILRSVAPEDQRVLLAQADTAFVADGATLALRSDSPSPLLPPPRPGGGGARPPQAGLPGIEAPSGGPPRMSTKGLEAFADPALQEGLERIAADNFAEIYGARGPAVPVSRWHDAAGLQARLKLAPEDYLNAPVGHTFGSDELALGKHYLGDMKRQAQDLEARITAGQVEDVAAAQAELSTRNRDVVRMMAKLQGQGSSEAGRSLRMLQEALDPQGLAETPKERLQLALLKHYGARNADEAAAIEAKAVARLKAQAAREARKSARAATAQELSEEFGSLLGELDSLTKRPRGMGGGPVPLDPELVAVIGRLAKNRVKAGVVAVEELADAVYMAIRDKVDVSREQVKASIVEHALAKPPKEDARLARAEAAAKRSIKQMEERVAAGGAPKPKPAPVTSPELERLRARQAQLREQLATMRGKGPADPAVRRLKTAEAAAARRVKKLEEKLAAGPTMPKPSAAPVESQRLSALRQRAADLKSQIEKDPRHSLVQRYRELLDDETVDMIAKLPDPMEDPESLVSFLRQMEKPTFRDFRTTYWLNSILSGVKTSARNLVGNVAKLGTDQIMRVPGAAVEQFVVAPLQGRAPERLVRAELPAVAATFKGLPDGIRKFAFVMRNGYDPARLVGELTGDAAKWHEGAPLPLSPFLLSNRPAVRALGVPLTMPSRILEATDALFKTMAMTSEGYAWATRKALQEGAPDIGARVAQLLAEQPDEMVKAQTLAAQKATYQDPMSWVGQTASAIRRGPPGADKLAQELKAKGGVGNRALAAVVNAPATIGQHLIPFIHVSDRVAASITDFIPGAKPFKTARLLAEQSPEAADLLARQAVGGALGLLGIVWAGDGKLVGAAPKDEKLRNDFYAAGKQPYSLLVGGRWVPMRDLLGPLAGPFVAAAQYHDHLQVGEDPSSAVSGMTLATADYMLDASYLQSLQDVVTAVQEEKGGAGRKLEAAAARVAGGYVPFSGLAGNVAQALDPRVVEKEGFVDELKSRLPGLRDDLPARVGTLGEELRSSTGPAGGFLPVVPTENQVADVALEEEVGRLRYTVERRRTEINRAEAGIKDARKVKDREREAELLATIPRNPADRAQADAALSRVRGLEQQVRKLRANESMPEDQRRAREIALQKRMQDILSKALQRLGGR